MFSTSSLPGTWEEYLSVNSQFTDTQVYELLGTGLYSEFNCLSIAILSALHKRKRLVVGTSLFTMCNWGELFNAPLPSMEAEPAGAEHGSELMSLRRIRRNSVYLDALGIPLWFGQEYGPKPVFRARAEIAKIMHVPSFPIHAPFDYQRTKFCAVQIRGGDKINGYWSNGKLVIENNKSPTESYLDLLGKHARPPP